MDRLSTGVASLAEPNLESHGPLSGELPLLLVAARTRYIIALGAASLRLKSATGGIDANGARDRAGERSSAT